MSEEIRDITQMSMVDMVDYSGINNPDELRKLKERTPARIGIGHTGARYKTLPMLRFLADQAAASDAVFTEVDEAVIKKLGVFEVKTKCSSKYEMLTRPDWGRIFDEDQKQIIKEKCVANPQVQIYFGDGLCSPSIGANIPDLYPAIRKGLEYENVTVGTPFFVRYCRISSNYHNNHSEKKKRK